jgi:hypothetical protein
MIAMARANTMTGKTMKMANKLPEMLVTWSL